MSWFSGLGHALNNGVKSFDHLATKLDPLTHFNSWATANTLGKIPGVGPKIDNLQGKLANHPLEGSLAAYSAYMLAGLGGLGGTVGEGAGAAAGAGAGAAADATAMGGAAGTLGAADSAAASAGLGLSAADVGGGTAALDATAMGASAGTLGAADSALASSDLGLTAADVGGGATAFTPGDFAGMSLGGDTSSAGFGAGQTAGDFLASGGDFGAAGPSTSSGFGGVGTDAGVAASPDGGLALGQQAAGSAAPGVTQDILKTALKYGPAGLSLLRSVMGQGAAVRAANAYGNVGATQRATANGLVSGYNNGTLNPAESAASTVGLRSSKSQRAKTLTIGGEPTPEAPGRASRTPKTDSDGASS